MVFDFNCCEVCVAVGFAVVVCHCEGWPVKSNLVVRVIRYGLGFCDFWGAVVEVPSVACYARACLPFILLVGIVAG